MTVYPSADTAVKLLFGFLALMFFAGFVSDMSRLSDTRRAAHCVAVWFICSNITALLIYFASR